MQSLNEPKQIIEFVTGLGKRSIKKVQISTLSYMIFTQTGLLI